MDVSVNAAMSADGKLSSRRREQIAISGDADFSRVDRLRGEVDAITVGVGTVLADDPSLVRYDETHRTTIREGENQPPARVVLDSTAKTPADAAILDGDRRTFVVTSENAPDRCRASLRESGAELVTAGAERVDMEDAFAALESQGIERMLVEGGGEVIFSLFESGLVDTLSVYVGNMIIGGRDAPTLADGDGFVTEFPELELVSVDRLDTGVVLEWDVV